MDSMTESVTRPVADAVLPTGHQYEISAAGYRAVICELGATIRSLSHDGEDLLLTFSDDQIPAGSQGMHLLPWPNRIRDGRYVFDGVAQQLPINEIPFNNAIHGLTRWQAWTPEELTDDKVTQSLLLLAQKGWPGCLRLTLTHRVSADGLTVEVGAVNVGSTAVPFGYAAHPYLTAGDLPVDQWSVTAPFNTFLDVDDRKLPAALHPVDGRPEDLRSGGRIGDRVFDTAFTDAPDRAGWRIEVQAGDRHRTMWGGPGLDWAQIYTPGGRASLAVEPMSCGPDAFNEGPTHDSMLRLEPGDEVHLEWGLSI